MPAMQVTVSHTLGKEQAAERLKSLLAQIKENFGDQVSGLEETWNDDGMQFGFSTHGMKISGAVAVQDESVQLDGKIPFAATIFKGKIVKEVQSALERALA